jgi:hypothetical protein
MRRWRVSAGAVAVWLAAACVWAGDAGGGADVEVPRDAVDLLQRQVRYLTDALIEARAEADVLRARLDRKAFEKAGGLDAADSRAGGEAVREAVIVEVNRGLGLVVIGAGRTRNVRPGMVFAVMRNERKVAQVRVIESRAEISGAVIESRQLWSFPKATDRLVMVGSPAE